MDDLHGIGWVLMILLLAGTWSVGFFSGWGCRSEFNIFKAPLPFWVDV
jgi:hypothetical protein